MKRRTYTNLKISNKAFPSRLVGGLVGVCVCTHKILRKGHLKVNGYTFRGSNSVTFMIVIS